MRDVSAMRGDLTPDRRWIAPISLRDRRSVEDKLGATGRIGDHFINPANHSGRSRVRYGQHSPGADAMWIPKWQRDRDRGVDSPIPTQVVSNEEFIPRPQNAK